MKVQRLNGEIERLVAGMAEQDVAVPADLRQRVEAVLAKDRRRAWDMAVVDFAGDDAALSAARQVVAQTNCRSRRALNAPSRSIS